MSAKEKHDAKDAIRLGGALIAFAGISALMMSAYDDDKEFQQFNEELRATNWFFKFGDTWVVFPKPFQAAVGGN